MGYVKMRLATVLYQGGEARIPAAEPWESAAKPQRPELVSYAAPAEAAPLGVSIPYPMTGPAVPRPQGSIAAPAPPPSAGPVKALPASATFVSSQPPVMATVIAASQTS